MKETTIYDSEAEKEPITEEGLIGLGFYTGNGLSAFYLDLNKDSYLQYDISILRISILGATKICNCKTIQDVKELIRLLK